MNMANRMQLKHPTTSLMQAANINRDRRECLEEDGRPVKKPRASRPKVKSGCITCKTRRVKCDETKPQCLRCQKFGRQCDGYVPEPPPQSRALIELRPRIPTGNLYGPSTSIHETEAESQYFRVFEERAAIELCGFFEPSFWTRLVLQASHNVAAIRHAVLALGALNKSLESAPHPQLKVNDIESIDKKHHEQAFFQHIKAIQALNQYISNSQAPQLRNALIACLLFVCFETFQGSYASSVQQTYGGLKILQNYYVGTSGSRPSISRRQSLPQGRNGVRAPKALMGRTGHENVQKEVSMHVEEYLASGNEPHLIIEDRNTQGQQDKHDYLANHSQYSPAVDHVKILSMGGATNFDMEQQHTRPTCISRMHTTTMRLSESPTSAPPEALELFNKAGYGFRKTSDSSSSLASTPVGYTGSYTPPSTGPHTPSSQLTIPYSTPSLTPAPRKRPLASRSPTPLKESPSLKNDLSMEEILIQTFIRLDGQGLFFGLTPSIPSITWDVHNLFHVPVPPSFPSFESAQKCWDFLMDRALQFYRRTAFNRAYSPLSADPPAIIAKEYATYSNLLIEFERSFQPFLDEAVSPAGEILNAAALVLSLYPKAVAIMISTTQDDSEMVYDSFIDEFRYIIKTCALLIEKEDRIQLPRNKRFSFDIGIVPVLHITATKCRDPMLRREAIDFLFKSPRQEGMWDGVLSARIGMWVMACEEDGPTVPELREGAARDSSGASNKLRGKPFTDYPSPPEIVDESGHGCWQDGKKICDITDVMIAERDIHIGKPRAKGPGSLTTHKNLSVRKGSENEGGSPQTNGWMVPEGDRVKLTVVDFHIPERYIKIKCQRALFSEDGSLEQRETVIAW